jgi:hypothetical protein
MLLPHLASRMCKASEKERKSCWTLVRESLVKVMKTYLLPVWQLIALKEETALLERQQGHC